MTDAFCSEVARQEGAPLGGTATRADAWLLVEHDGPWGAAGGGGERPAAGGPGVAAGAGRRLEGRGRQDAAAAGPPRGGAARARRSPASWPSRARTAGSSTGSTSSVTRSWRRSTSRRCSPAASSRSRAASRRLGAGLRQRPPRPLLRALRRADLARARRGARRARPGSPPTRAATATPPPGCCCRTGVAYGFLPPDEAEPLLAARGRGAHPPAPASAAGPSTTRRCRRPTPCCARARRRGGARPLAPGRRRVEEAPGALARHLRGAGGPARRAAAPRQRGGAGELRARQAQDHRPLHPRPPSTARRPHERPLHPGRRLHRRALPRQPGGGGACSTPGRRAHWMQSVAAEMNLSETAFLVPPGRRRRLRPALVHARRRGRALRPRHAGQRAGAVG